MMHSYRPMMAKIASRPFSSENWIFEIKWDGFRAIAYVNQELSLRSRNDKELKYSFPELQELTELTQKAILDGEIVIMRDGKQDFQALLERSQASSPIEMELEAKRSPAVYIVFDILEKDGISLLNMPLIERKKILKKSVSEGKHVLLSDFVKEKGEVYYSIALEKGLEGIIAKKKDSFYEPGVRSGSWLKIRKILSCDCVIFGYTRGSGARSETFGALLLGLYGKEQKPIYVGKVGTGFSQIVLETLVKTLRDLKTEFNPFSIDLPGDITWLRPELVCQVAYQSVTKDGRLRMPRFGGLRKDKEPSECTIDQISHGQLTEYHSKRDFNVTAEPIGTGKKGGGKNFVVHEHHSRKLHYDLRLEKEGVLKSWAVPKGVPSSSDQKRLAVQTEDHPLEYASFEGEIPKGQYGAGTVRIWDRGKFETKVWDQKMIEFTLKGGKLKGRYVLVKLKKGEGNNWLLLKGKE